MQPPCAAASSSSGLVLPPGSPIRDGSEKGSRANAPPEDAEHPHLARAAVLEAVDEPGRQVDARAGAQVSGLALDVERALTGKDVDDLVVLVEMVGGAPDRDVADELGHRLAAVLRLGEQRELASRSRRAALAPRDDRVSCRRGQRIFDQHGQDIEALRRLDLPRRPACDEDTGPRLELQPLVADRDDRAAGEDVEHLVALVVAALAASPVGTQQALPELGHGEERRHFLAGRLRLDAVAHRATLYGSRPSSPA
jgi:hypothetical protein